MGNKEKGFTTYTFISNGVQQCFTVYHPLSRKDQSLPVVMTAQCYARNKITFPGSNFKDIKDRDNLAAAKYGFARISLSSPTLPRGNWAIPSCKLKYDQN